MASFEAIRDRLPAVYRPEDEDLADEPIALAPADLLELDCAPSMLPAVQVRGRMLHLTLPGPATIRALRLAPGRAPSPAYALAIYPLGNGTPTGRPAAVAAVRDGLAALPVPLPTTRFAVELRRRSLLSSLLLGIGEVLDETDRSAAEVLQSHWFQYADRAMYSRFFLLRRQLEGQPGPPPAGDPALFRFPYVQDLARLAGLLSVAPRREPPSDREPVEPFRERVRRTVALYAGGLGTMPALRRMVEIQLPIDVEAPPERRDLGFALEEQVALGRDALDVRASGPPEDTLGPLMRWAVDNRGRSPAPPTVYVQGVEPGEGAVDATERPLVELYAAGDRRVRLGLAYRGTLAARRTLRLRPAYRSWLGVDGGVEGATSVPEGTSRADPTARGPWAHDDDGPSAPVVALAQTQDGALWAAVNGSGGGELARYDGVTWTTAVTGLADLRCLAADGARLLAGTDDGLAEVPLHPVSGQHAATPVAGIPESVNALAQVSPGEWLVGTGRGVTRLVAGAAPAPYVLGTAAATEVEVLAIAADGLGALYFGTSIGLLEHQPALGRSYWYLGGVAAEQAAEWRSFTPGASGQEGALPAPGEVFLPPVRAVVRAPDGALWLGTAAGLARYVARTAEGLALTTLLEAFPDLGTEPVAAVARDPRDAVWLATGRGLLRADDRDLWHHETDGWRQLGRSDTVYADSGPEPRGAWRFVRATERWQRFRRGAGWVDHEGEPRTQERRAVRALLWTDGVTADVGVRDPATKAFAGDASVPADQLVMRYKPDADRIVDGGLPHVPRIPAGRSTWRYLSLESAADPAPSGRPAWTREGRRLPAEPATAPPAEGEPGRFDIDIPPSASQFDRSVFAYLPAARLRMEWEPTEPLSVLARLEPPAGGAFETAVIDRVWAGMQQVRPAGVRTALAVGETIVRGENGGPDV